MLFPIIDAHGGRVVKTLGDAILGEFEESVGAIKAAAGMQRAQQNFEAERRDLKTQIAGMQASFLDSTESSNNPAGTAIALRDQVEVRVQKPSRIGSGSGKVSESVLTPRLKG